MESEFRTGAKYALMVGAIIFAFVMVAWLLGDWYVDVIAPRPNEGPVYGIGGFLLGVVHMVMLLPDLLISYFNSDISVYQGGGPAYNTGFVLGWLVFTQLFSLSFNFSLTFNRR